MAIAAAGDYTCTVTAIAPEDGNYANSEASAQSTPMHFSAVVLSVEGDGTASASVVYAVEGTEVSLSATGSHFAGWEVVSGNVSIKDGTFIMPAEGVEIQAVFADHSPDNTGWHSDVNGHWQTCECGEKFDAAAHRFEWVVDREATETEAGSKHEECTVCGYEKEPVEVPATGTGKASSADGSPATGDAGSALPWAVGGLLALAAAAAAGLRRKAHGR